MYHIRRNRIGTLEMAGDSYLIQLRKESNTSQEIRKLFRDSTGGSRGRREPPLLPEDACRFLQDKDNSAFSRYSDSCIASVVPKLPEAGKSRWFKVYEGSYSPLKAELGLYDKHALGDRTIVQGAKEGILSTAEHIRKALTVPAGYALLADRQPSRGSKRRVRKIMHSPRSKKLLDSSKITTKATFRKPGSYPSINSRKLNSPEHNSVLSKKSDSILETDKYPGYISITDEVQKEEQHVGRDDHQPRDDIKKLVTFRDGRKDTKKMYVNNNAGCLSENRMKKENSVDDFMSFKEDMNLRTAASVTESKLPDNQMCLCVYRDRNALAVGGNIRGKSVDSRDGSRSRGDGMDGALGLRRHVNIGLVNRPEKCCDCGGVSFNQKSTNALSKNQEVFKEKLLKQLGSGRMSLNLRNAIERSNINGNLMKVSVNGDESFHGIKKSDVPLRDIMKATERREMQTVRANVCFINDSYGKLDNAVNEVLLRLKKKSSQSGLLDLRKGKLGIAGERESHKIHLYPSNSYSELYRCYSERCYNNVTKDLIGNFVAGNLLTESLNQKRALIIRRLRSLNLKSPLISDITDTSIPSRVKPILQYQNNRVNTNPISGKLIMTDAVKNVRDPVLEQPHSKPCFKTTKQFSLIPEAPAASKSITEVNKTSNKSPMLLTQGYTQVIASDGITVRSPFSPTRCLKIPATKYPVQVQEKARIEAIVHRSAFYDESFRFPRSDFPDLRAETVHSEQHQQRINSSKSSTGIDMFNNVHQIHLSLPKNLNDHATSKILPATTFLRANSCGLPNSIGIPVVFNNKVFPHFEHKNTGKSIIYSPSDVSNGPLRNVINCHPIDKQHVRSNSEPHNYSARHGVSIGSPPSLPYSAVDRLGSGTDKFTTRRIPNDVYSSSLHRRATLPPRMKHGAGCW